MKIIKSDALEQASFAKANPNPVLSCGTDGELHFVNPATEQLLQDLKLDDIAEILPREHRKLVTACLQTSTALTQERKHGNRTLIWSYKRSSDKSEIYIYGHDVTDYQSNTPDTSYFPMANPSPVLALGTDGRLDFLNPATTQLLQDAGVQDIAEILPPDHGELVQACLHSSSPVTGESRIAGRVLAWLYRSVSETGKVNIYGHDVTDYQAGALDTVNFPNANPSPVLATGANGEVHYANPATTQLLQDLKLNDIADILPLNHNKLAQACLKSSIPLTEERKVGGRTVVWLYHSVSGSNEAYVYGHDISGCDPKIFCIEGFPRANPNPVFSALPDGMPRYMNHAVSQLLQELELESTEDILPHNHIELVDTVLKTNAPVIRERQVCGRTIIWSYHPIDESDMIYIYGQDITGYHRYLY